MIAGLGQANWKERLSSIETINNKIKGMPADEVPVQVLVRTLAKKPGFKDTHFQVLKQRVELVGLLADQGFNFSQRSASYCINEIAEKIGDLKVGEQVKETLCKISDQVTFAYVVQTIVPSVFTAKNPKNHENLINWLTQYIPEFGFTGIEMKFMLKYIKEALASTNPAVRSAVYPLIACVYMYAGPSFAGLFEQEKPAILEQINGEIEKVKGQKPPVPSRGWNVPKASRGGQDDDGAAGDDVEEDDPAEAQRKQEALLPRTDISEQLNEALMEQMSDKNWKERQAGLEKLEQILRDNKFVEANLPGDFLAHLAKRLTDTNKILATTTLKITEKLALALGSQVR